MNRLFPRLVGSAMGLAYVACCSYLLAQDSPSDRAAERIVAQQKGQSKTQFMRVLRDMKKKPIALETNIVRYVSDDGDFTVDLVGVVHIGDGLYYEKLNRRFEEYDVVLYELVAPKGMARPRRGARSDNPISLLQGMMTTVLGLDLQTRRIDYTKQNFVHADLSPEEMMAALEKRGDNIMSFGLKVLGEMMQQYNLRQQKEAKKAGNGAVRGLDVGEFDPLTMLLDPSGPQKLKAALAEEFEAQGLGEDGGLTPTLSTLLVDDRNAACMKVLAKQKAAGKKKMAIFYGAAHMPDFEKRLKKDYGLKRKGITWLTAWDLERRGGGLLQLFEPPR